MINIWIHESWSKLALWQYTSLQQLKQEQIELILKESKKRLLTFTVCLNQPVFVPQESCPHCCTYWPFADYEEKYYYDFSFPPTNTFLRIYLFLQLNSLELFKCKLFCLLKTNYYISCYGVWPLLYWFYY